MKTFRPLRTFGATLSAVGALLILCFAIQDLWTYQRNVAKGYTAWAVTGQGWWQLSYGIGEAIAVVVLLVVAGRLLGTKFARSMPIPQP